MTLRASSLKPVVPITIALPALWQTDKASSVASGRVKSIKTSKSLSTRSISSPLLSIESCDTLGLSLTASIKACPIRPFEPVIAILVI